MEGPYDEGYRKCDCFWGREPGSLIGRLLDEEKNVENWQVLDVGCGEGKNAHALAMRGCHVIAVDASRLALESARKAWSTDGIDWRREDVRDSVWPDSYFDLIVAYGVLHCLRNAGEIANTVAALKRACRPAGYHLLCAFNDRQQDLSAHPGFSPCLLSHQSYIFLYRDWTILYCSDEDLREVHPHNGIPHSHSLTRLIARRSS